MINVNIDNYPDNKADIKLYRGDIKNIQITVVDTDSEAVDLTDWDNFYLTISSERNPVSDVTEIGQIVGVVEDQETDTGVVSFLFNADIPAGHYFYDIQADRTVGLIDETLTLIKGNFKLIQDITKG